MTDALSGANADRTGITAVEPEPTGSAPDEPAETPLPYEITTAGDGGGPDSVELYLLRHADAGNPHSWGGPDEDRPLSSKGRKQAKRLGRWLKATGFQADIFVTSPKRRAAETADLVAAPLKADVQPNARLAGDLGLESAERVLAECGDHARVVLVGHDPDFSALLALLCGASRIPMKKGALARIDAERPLRPGGGTLRWLIPPDLLKAGG